MNRSQLHQDGFCVVPDALTPRELADVNVAVDAAIERARRLGVTTYTEGMDPNDRNIRLYTLPEFDPIFVELLRKPSALALVRELLGDNFIVSSFSGNIALPGSGSMNLHADQALVIPPPWNEAWTMNIIWCLDDVHEGNGATRYVPGSHRFRNFDEVPDDALEHSRAFEAKAGSIIAMDGRLWHTSGHNVSVDERRAMLFAYYAMDFIRPQTNHEAALSSETKAGLDDDARALLGLGAAANVRIGANLVQLADSGPVNTAHTMGQEFDKAV